MLHLTDEQRLIVDSLRDLTETEFADNACSWEDEPPRENVELLANHGFLGMEVDEVYGGGGLSENESLLLLETVGRVCPDTAYAVAGHQLIPSRAIELFGSDSLKEQYLPALVSGDRWMVTAISEPEAGSDVGSMNTHVEERDGDLILNGGKIWVSGVPEASAAVVWVKFPEGLGSVVIDLDTNGIEVAETYTNMHGGPQSQLYFEDVTVPQENVLTRGRDAFKEQLVALNWERLFSAALANGIAACAFDKALEYAKQREQFDQPIADFQGIEWKLATMATKIQLSRALTHSVAKTATETDTPPSRLNTSIANYYSATMVERVVSEALQIHGANGYQQGHELEYLYRFARSRRIAAGTDEIQKNTISGALKRNGLPNL